jgi:hypothetical protein
MKTFVKIFFCFFAFGFAFTACDDDNDDGWSTVFISNYSTTFDVTTSSDTSTNDGTFYVSNNINPRSDRNYWYYRYYITQSQVQSITAKVTYANYANITIDSCTLTFYSYDNDTIIVRGRASEASWALGNETFTQGTNINFTNSNGQFAKIENLFLSYQPFGIKFEGSTSENNAEFDVQLQIQLLSLAQY